MIFGSARFALFVKSIKTVRFLARYGSRYKILTENDNELCTVRFALFIEKTEHGGLFGAVRFYGSRVKTETENGVFLQRYGKRFSLKNGKRYGFRLRCRGFLSPNRGNCRSRNGRVRYGQGDKFGRTSVS